MKGAKREYRLTEIAQDLNVPSDFVIMYKDAERADYFGFMPVELDCVVAELEDGEAPPDCWAFIQRKYGGENAVADITD